MSEASQAKPELAPAAPHRPWLAPLIATVLAAILFLVLLVPGVLRYREGPDVAVLSALEESNETLRREITRLGEADADGVCTYQGGLYSRPDAPFEEPPRPEDRLNLLPPAPQTLTPDEEARGGAAFEGNMDDLLRASTVLVMRTEESGFGFGSGFFITDRHVATNAHVVGSVAEVLITNDLIKAPLRARIVQREGGIEGAPMPQADFALLELEAPVPSAKPLALAPPVRTGAVYASGYPGFFVQEQVIEYARAALSGQPAEPPQGVVSDGIVTTIQSAQRPAGELKFLAHSARLSQGNSGGPLVDACGRVVGINTFIRQSGGSGPMMHGDFALSSVNLQAFLGAAGTSARFIDGPCAPPAPEPSAAAPGAGSAPAAEAEER